MTDITPEQIIHLLENKRFDEAISQCNILLEKGIKHPQLLLFLALAHGRKGDMDTSNLWFGRLQSLIGDHPEVHYNRGLVLQENERLSEAAAAYRRCVTQQPDHAPAWNNLGLVEEKRGHTETAIEALNRAVSLQPGHLDYRRNLAEALQANHAYAAALPHWQFLTASHEQQLGDWLGLIKALTVLIQLKDAVQATQQALTLYPQAKELWLWMGRLNIDRKKYTQALHWLEKYQNDCPGDEQCLKDLAAAYSHSGLGQKLNAVIPEILQTEDAALHAFLIELLIMGGQLERAQQLLDAALKKWPDDPALLLHQAKVLRQQKAHRKALALIDNYQSRLKVSSASSDATSDDPMIAADFNYEKGANLDKLKQYDAAWEAFSQANEQMHRLWSKISPQPDAFLARAHDLAAGFQHQPRPQVNADMNTATPHRLVFVVGFPRSGTTLIDNILAAHPEVTVLEEAQILSEVYESIEGISSKNYAEKLSQLTADEINRLRRQYFDLLPDYVPGPVNRTVVDKSPMNALHAALIHRLFPEAPIIFAQRHPADVILSCFMQNFQLNGFMTNLLEINQAARAYDALLSVWQAATSQWQIPYYAVVYEKLVSDFEPEARELVKQAGLPWHDDILRYHEKTAERGTITTPSYHQASQPVYTSSRFRHLNYLPHMQTAMQTLQPWISKLGYATQAEGDLARGESRI